VATNGLGTSHAQFCWATSCTQGRASSYQFTVSALDNGCPAKTSNVVYTINVEPTLIAGLTGPDTVCSSSASTNIYAVTSIPAYTYQWVVTGGSQVSGGNSASAGIQWTATNGQVGVYALNTQGCHSDTLSMNVIASNPVADAGNDVSFCNGASASLGTAAVPNQTYLWSPSTGLSSNTVANPTVTLPNTGSVPIINTYYLTVSQPGCTASDTVNVTVNAMPNVGAGLDFSACVNAASVALNGVPAGGNFSGAGVTANQFNPATAGVGAHDILYSLYRQRRLFE
jgi:hypothetical protein